MSASGLSSGCIASSAALTLGLCETGSARSTGREFFGHHSVMTPLRRRAKSFGAAARFETVSGTLTV
jgi:hypothetical protein